MKKSPAAIALLLVSICSHADSAPEDVLVTGRPYAFTYNNSDFIRAIQLAQQQSALAAAAEARARMEAEQKRQECSQRRGQIASQQSACISQASLAQKKQ